MIKLGGIVRWLGTRSTLPPISDNIRLSETVCEEALPQTQIEDFSLQSIAAFCCVIKYADELRLITCRRYDVISAVGYVGAICHASRGYRQFRCDRIDEIYDAQTGELLGDGTYFARFEPDSARDRAPSWGLKASQKAKLVAGLNVLAFMARCDGRWHRLEDDIVEKFICTMWLRKEWPGDPDIVEIVTHAHRLAPDADALFKALRYYANSRSSALILTRHVSELMAADGVICESEINWGTEISTFLSEYDDEAFVEMFNLQLNMKIE